MEGLGQEKSKAQLKADRGKTTNYSSASEK
jgi:hypothetical protein